jgi:hypothetical protein
LRPVRKLAIPQAGQKCRDRVAQLLKIDLASAHDRRCIRIVSQSKQKVSLRGIWMTPLFGDGERPVQRLVQALGKDGHGGGRAVVIPYDGHGNLHTFAAELAGAAEGAE